MLRTFAPLALILLTGSAVAALQEVRGSEPSIEFASLIEAERVAQKLPGLAAVIVQSDGVPRVYVSGERRLGKGDPIGSADRMHLGSLTKAITATLIGALVERKLMTFETTIAQTFPELSAKIDTAYRGVTVRQLLSHAAGTPVYGTTLTLRPLMTLTGTPTEQRYAFVERALAEPPRFTPGTSHEYSNAGAAIAGAMAERIGRAPYPQLVQQLIFDGLGGSATFGNPGLASQPQPWGHLRTMLGTIEVPPENPIYTTPLAIEPAGGASPSLPDTARFLQLHLRGLRGRDDALKAATIRELQKTPGSAMAWAVVSRDGVESHQHFGSSGTYVAYAVIQPSRDVAVAVFTNTGGQDVRDAVANLALRIATRVAGGAGERAFPLHRPSHSLRASSATTSGSSSGQNSFRPGSSRTPFELPKTPAR